MNTGTYFKRIGYSGEASISHETLAQIHHLHPQAIPFENLSSFLGLSVSLEPGKVFSKLVEQGRGGYCFEHNLVLATVLRDLGFQVSEHAARVLWRSPDKTQMPRTHMLLKVTVQGQDYIADVGFGGLTMTAPLLLEPGLVQHSPHEDFLITQQGAEYILSTRLAGKQADDWRQMYVFDLVPQYPADFEMANYFVSSHPQSLFVHNLMLGRPETDSRHALQNRVYTCYSHTGEKIEKTITDVGALLALLRNTFNIRLEEPAALSVLSEKFEKLE